MSGSSIDVVRGNGTARLLGRAAAVGLALLLGACAQNGELSLGLGGEPKVSDISTASAGERPEVELEKATAYWGEQYNKNPKDGKAALNYARNLKALGRKQQALAVLQAAYLFSGDDRDFLSEYGRLALEHGQVSTADQLLSRADDPAKPDWRILSARGTVFAKQGRLKQAIEFFERARGLAPDKPSILNNLAMAYTMDGQAARGEELLRSAKASGADDRRIEQNLALVRDLQGKAEDAAPAAQPAVAAQGGFGQTTVAQAQAITTHSTGAPASRSSSWDKPLPIEAGSAPARGRAKAAKPLDPDEVIRRAMAADQAKSAGN